jgi:hypothetical protein
MAGALTLLASTTVTTTGSATAAIVPDVSKAKAALFFLDVTAAATEAGDTLDVYIQHSPDGGTTYDDFVHFTQATGTGTIQALAQWTAYSAVPETEMRAPQDAVLAAGAVAPQDAVLAAGAVVQGPVGDDWRIKYSTTDVTTTGNMSFTFSVRGRLIYE